MELRHLYAAIAVLGASCVSLEATPGTARIPLTPNAPLSGGLVVFTGSYPTIGYLNGRVTSLRNPGPFYYHRGQLDLAEPLYRKSLEMREKILGPEHPDVAHSLNRLAGLLRKRHKDSQAVPLLKRSLAMYEKALGPASLESAATRTNLAALYRDRAEFALAEPLYVAALASVEKNFGSESPNLTQILDGYALMLRRARRVAEAQHAEQRASRLRKLNPAGSK